MTFWLYKPKQFFKSSSILPYKSQDAGDVLNFLTLMLLSFVLIMKNKIDNDTLKKISIVGFLLILFFSLFTSSSTEETETIGGMEVPKQFDYDTSISVD